MSSTTTSRPTLFGVDVPPAAVRVVVRPILGRGHAQPLFDGPLDDDAGPLTDTEVMVSASRNGAFWEYLDAQVAGGRIERPDDNQWSWKLRIEFFDQDNVRSNAGAVVTAEAYKFYRAAKKNAADGGGVDARVIMLFERGIALLDKGMAVLEAVKVGCMASVDKSVAAISSAHEKSLSALAAAQQETGKASAQALAEVSKTVSHSAELAKKLQEETGDLKELAFGLLREKQAPQAQKGLVGEVKELGEVVTVFKGIVNTLGGGAEAPATPAPSPPGDK